MRCPGLICWKLLIGKWESIARTPKFLNVRMSGYFCVIGAAPILCGESLEFNYVQFPNHNTLHSCARRRCWGIMFASYPGAHCNAGILGEGHLTLGQLEVDLSECISLRLWLTGMAESTLGQRLCPDAQCHAGWGSASRWWEFFSSLSCDPKRSK